MWRDGLRENTLEVFDKVSQLDCIKDLYLCGGTGISVLLQAGYSFEEGLDYALKFTRHQVHSKAVLSALITPTLYPKPQDFDLMQPKYAVSPEEMANYFMQVIASRKK